MFRTRDMKQAATYYPPNGTNAFGDPQFLAGVSVMVRWEDKSVLFRDAQGREATSSAVVYVAQEVEIAGRLGLGSAALDDAREIRQVHISPSLRNDERLVQAML